MRWLAIAHWYPFAAMIISLALLGHGASGTWLSLWLRGRPPVWLAARFDAAFAGCALLFALSAALALAIAGAIPFNGLELVWNPRQLLWLSALYLVLAVPFFFAASCFGLAFARHGERIPLLYGADLLGAGLGALTALALAYLPVERGLLLAALCGPCAAVLVLARRGVVIAAALVAVVLITLLPGRTLAPRPNEFKGLSKALLLPEAKIVAQHSGPYGWLAMLDSPRVPLRYAPGLSLNFAGEPPAQLGLYTDGDALSVIVHNEGPGSRRSQLRPWFGAMTSALPYALRTPRSVLVLGAGGGMDVAQALALGAHRVDAVELDPQRLRWVREDYARYAGQLYRDPRVRVFVAEPRAFVRASATRYDLIVLAGGDSFASSGAGVQAASEQYALTVEALRDYRARLTPPGMLVITRWSKQPPRDELKLFATAIAALREEGVAAPASQLAAVRNWDASTWLIARQPFTANELAALKQFAAAHGFDPVHVPGWRIDASQRFHLLEPPNVFDGTHALLSPQARDYVRAYKFAIAPARDDRPYFGHYFRWRSLPELWRLREQGSAVLLDSGYLLLVAALLQAVPLALLLVLLPLRALPHPADEGATARIAVARPRRRLLPRTRPGVPADRDRDVVAAHPAGRAPAAGSERGAGRIPAVRGRGQPAHAALAVAMGWRCRRRGRRDPRRAAYPLGRARHRLRVAVAIRGVLPRLCLQRCVAGVGTRGAGIDRDRAARLRHGYAVRAGAVPAGAYRAGVRAVGMGAQRLRLGDRGDRGCVAGDGVRHARDIAVGAGAVPVRRLGVAARRQSEARQD